jgi:small subunit ribosomal protein S8e
LETGNFSWGSESITKKTRIISVVYNASNNELVRTNTLVKSSIIQIDATPFRQWYESYYGVQLTKRGKKAEVESTPSTTQTSPEKAKKETQAQPDKKRETQGKNPALDPKLEELLSMGRFYACITSRPGQSGRCDGYVWKAKNWNFIPRG